MNSLLVFSRLTICLRFVLWSVSMQYAEVMLEGVDSETHHRDIRLQRLTEVTVEVETERQVEEEEEEEEEEQAEGEGEEDSHQQETLDTV